MHEQAQAQETVAAAYPAPPAPESYRIYHRTPSPVFANDLLRLTGYEEICAGRFRQIETASLVIPMIISFGEPFAIGLGHAPGSSERFGTFTAGLFAGPVIIESVGKCCCIQVDFTPLGARRFFNIPLRELTNRMVDLDAVLGPGVNSLRQRLGEERDWQRRFDLAEAFVYRRLLASPTSCNATRLAYRQLSHSGGTMKISRIAAQLEWSRKHLAARFHDEIGLPPKSVARIIRFNRVLDLAREKTANWADIAAHCGYADQAHMAREFQEFSGQSPARWQNHSIGA